VVVVVVRADIIIAGKWERQKRPSQGPAEQTLNGGVCGEKKERKDEEEMEGSSNKRNHDR
jgi:hypothetical protein